MRFVFTCGGTAGHINPAIAVAGRLREAMPDAQFLFIGAKDRMEADLVPRAGYELKTVKITNIRRGFKPEDISHNLNTVKNVLTSTAEARGILREFRPDCGCRHRWDTFAIGPQGPPPVLNPHGRFMSPTRFRDSRPKNAGAVC
jgi:UDP-N-acetylglucosamine:LPS N-acetylglucosamine transferase